MLRIKYTRVYVRNTRAYLGIDQKLWSRPRFNTLWPVLEIKELRGTQEGVWRVKLWQRMVEESKKNSIRRLIPKKLDIPRKLIRK